MSTQSNEIAYFAKTNFRGQDAIFGIKTDDRRRHMYLIGKTGMGKTNLLEHLVLQDIRNGHGVAYVDPHGDTAEKLIRMIPPERIQDVIYFNPADQNFPIAFNVMEQVDPEYRHLVASGLVGVFKKLWADSWGPRLEYVLRNAILALLECPGSTLLGVMRIFVDKKYRASVVNQITDPVIKSFWVDEFTKWSDKVLQEVVSPIQNKVGQFLSTSLIRNIVGQTHSSFSIREAMDKKKIIIMNLSKGRIGEDNSALLGAMMVTKIQMAAMARVDMAEEDRKDFYLYVDEFQNFATESFANILSEARKYRLNLILANQYVTQILEEVRDAIFGNAGTLIAFRVGATDAEFLEKEFDPVFLMNDMVNLPKYHIYLKLMIDGIAGDAFSATTLPPIETEGVPDTSEKVIVASRERYTSSKEAVEQGIRDWSGVFTPPIVNRSAMTQEVRSEVRDQRQMNMTPKATFGTQYSRTNGFAQGVESQRSKEIDRNKTVNDQRQMEKSREEIVSSVTREVNIETTAMKRDDREWFAVACHKCGLEVQVPFRPDGRRPVFCKDCLKEHQRTMAKGGQGTSERKDRVFEKRETVHATVPSQRTWGNSPASFARTAGSVSPRQFSPAPKYTVPDLAEVREMVQTMRGNGSEEG